jgi:hypothetical protein
MNAVIHPHRGYLNTDFRILVKGEDKQHFDIYPHPYSEDNLPFVSGKASPHVPYILKFPSQGEFDVRFEDGTIIKTCVEDGYKFGGSSLKKGFIFDSCPWAFIVMHDRTYFHNRNTGEEYVEAISPDVITEVSNEYVIFESKEQEERTLYSLEDQQPVLCVTDIVFTNEKFLVWKEEEGQIEGASQYTILHIYSLSKRSIEATIRCQQFVCAPTANCIYIENDSLVEKIALEEEVYKSNLFSTRGEFITFANCFYAVAYDKYKEGILCVYNLTDAKVAGNINYEGTLVRINNHQVFNIYDRIKLIEKLTLSNENVPEATIRADYVEIDIQPCPWNVVYVIKTTKVIKRNDKTKVSSNIFLLSLDHRINQELTSSSGKVITTSSIFCYYTWKESFVCSKDYRGSGYKSDCSVYKHNDDIIMEQGDKIFHLSKNGYWDGERENVYNLREFEEFGVLINKQTEECSSISGKSYGEWKCKIGMNSIGHIICKDAVIYSDRMVIKRVDIPDDFVCFSPSYHYGIEILKGSVQLYEFKNDSFVKTSILMNLYDYTEYKNVLLSEGGKQIMYSDKEQTVVTDIASGKSTTYKNLSYIKHVNGIRPLFQEKTALQPRLINPVTKLFIDCDIMKEFTFVSPDGKYYADTQLDRYVEYYNKETNKVLSSEDYSRLLNLYRKPLSCNENSAEYKRMRENRKSFLYEHIHFLRRQEEHLQGNHEPSRSSNSEWVEQKIKYTSYDDAERFLDLLIERRGIAVIRKVSDRSEVIRIPMGEPLWFLNYVSFSYDSKYVAIGGRYPDESRRGGLFLVYDIENKQKVYLKDNSYAVWTTAFSKNMVAGYSSEPNTYMGSIEDTQDSEERNITEIEGYSFLSFSPDGKFFALSKQGYIAKRGKNGEERSIWGHQPSSLVSVRTIYNPTEELVAYNDISDVGISEVCNKQSVASISFSNNNEQLMMVGRDGVVIVRNVTFMKRINKVISNF